VKYEVAIKFSEKSLQEQEKFITKGLIKTDQKELVGKRNDSPSSLNIAIFAKREVYLGFLANFQFSIPSYQKLRMLYFT
jgi:hypothetical protein